MKRKKSKYSASQKRRLRTLKKHHHHVQKRTEIVVSTPRDLARPTSIIPKIRETVENQERIRRFISACLNVDLQAAERRAKQEGKELDKDLRKRLEIDWGTIPGVDKPFLMQPGAEKILHWLQIRPKFVKQEQDLGDGHLEVICRVVFYSKITGEEVFEGPDCSCSTMETNFRYVWAEADTMPSDEEKERLKAIKMGKMQKVFEWKKGKKVGERWAWFIRVDNPNIHNERNKVRQMGQKRGLVKGVRQMGAISSIFNSDPSEWDLEPEDTEGSPETEMDYTDGGRRILKDGVSPSGKYVSPEAQQKQARENAAKVAQGKLNENAAHGHPAGSEQAQQAEAALKRVEEQDAKLGKKQVWKGSIEIDLSIPDDPLLRGDIGNLLELIQKHCTATWKGDWWHILPKDVPTIHAMCRQVGYRVVEILPKQEPTRKKHVPDGFEVLNGTIERCTASMTTNNVPVRQVKIGGKWHPCYVNTIHDYLDRGIGKAAELFVDSKKKIIGAKRIGRIEFDEDGRTVVQKDRDSGTQTLFP